MSVRRIAASAVLFAIALLSAAWIPRARAAAPMACCKRKHAPGKPCCCRHADRGSAAPRLAAPASCARACGCAAPALRAFEHALPAGQPGVVCSVPPAAAASVTAFRVPSSLSLPARDARAPPARAAARG